jgi:SOS-response transcriptional repressor LexA
MSVPISRHTWEPGEYLQVIRDLIKEQGFPPTVREIADTLAERHEARPPSTSTVHATLAQLRRQGRIDWRPLSPRTIRVLEQPDLQVVEEPSATT